MEITILDDFHLLLIYISGGPNANVALSLGGSLPIHGFDYY